MSSPTRRRRGRAQRRAWTSVAVTAALVSLGLPQVAAAAAGETPSARAAGADTAVPSPDANLGSGWHKSKDVLVTGAGDETGFHVYTAHEDKAFSWQTLATLTAPVDAGATWTGNLCVTGSGRYAVAVYAPTAVANHAEGADAGGFAAVVDLSTGSAREITSGVSLAYFSPGCGAQDKVLLARYTGPEGKSTEVMAVDAASALITGTVRSDRQITNLTPARDGDYGIADSTVVRIGADGQLAKVAKPAGAVFALAASADNGLDLVSAKDRRAVAEHWTPHGLAKVGEAALDRLQLFQLDGGQNALVGDVAGLDRSVAGAPRALSAPKPVTALSRQGHLLADTVEPAWVTRLAGHGPTPDAAARQVRASVRTTHNGAAHTGSVTTADKVPTLSFGSASTTAPTSGLRSAPAAAKNSAVALTTGDSSSWGDVTGGLVDPTSGTESNWSVPKCAISRNDPNNQALQPTPAMVQWAVDRAVTNSLTVSRPANYLATGQPAYTPQGMFPDLGVNGYGRGVVPAQVMLGLLAQETNLAQATWHAVAGDSGNPLVADYYGNGNLLRSTADATAGHTTPVAINYPKADCGYGIGQVTTGMTAADTTTYTAAQKTAIATDYAANIAAGLQILEAKWNQISSAGLLPNGGDPHYIENWYTALWAYNTGYHPLGEDPAGYGLGFLNNPANPRYPANRQPFLRASYADAAKPGNWPYQEKVLGFAERPENDVNGQFAYLQPTYSVVGGLNLSTNYGLFCGSGNNCTPGPGCPAMNATCYWHGPAVNWISAPLSVNGSVQRLAYTGADPEPAMAARYPAPDCAKPSSWGAGTVVVYPVSDPNKNTYGCSGSAAGGKFTLRTGDNFDHSAYLANVDLHQFGAGFGGRMFFTHSYDSATITQDNFQPQRSGLPVPMNISHKVVATWEPDLTGPAYKIFVHLPSHGAQATNVPYYIYDGCGTMGQGLIPSVTNLDQSKSSSGQGWFQLGAASVLLCSGARVQVTNLIPNGGFSGPDIAFDAIAFVP
ncbi:hypothetical protein ABT095_06880 [Kitasatospora sp. NPDC002227]|uniref:hypothetical protein n=1 Tax=Kitasatospora sp. NPDC002227 TaxID=3154773 RepID=UPI003325ACCE